MTSKVFLERCPPMGIVWFDHSSIWNYNKHGPWLSLETPEVLYTMI